MERIYAAHRAYGEALTKAGTLVGGAELQPVASATTVRFARGRPRTTDGPFAETEEQLAVRRGSPSIETLPERLDTVLSVPYFLFNIVTRPRS